MSNAALAAYRKVRAVELALTGASYDQIAGELGYANRGTAWRAVQSGLKARRFAAVDDYREAELHRLERLERSPAHLQRQLGVLVGGVNDQCKAGEVVAATFVGSRTNGGST